ncbi:deoxyuridine 5'-triphosphate nucleotidohydrolase, partial [Elysia marginata]
MAYRNSTLFLLSPAPADDDQKKKVASFYPTGRQTLLKNNLRHDSGIDLPTPEDIEIPPGGAAVDVNLQVRAVCLRLHDSFIWGSAPDADLNKKPVKLPWGYRLAARSSISKTPLMLANGEGIIDLGYRGSLIAKVRNLSNAQYTITAGTALFQLVSADLAPPEFEILTPDDPRTEKYFSKGVTLRHTGAFGSTGAAGGSGRSGISRGDGAVVVDDRPSDGSVVVRGDDADNVHGGDAVV